MNKTEKTFRIARGSTEGLSFSLKQIQLQRVRRSAATQYSMHGAEERFPMQPAKPANASMLVSRISVETRVFANSPRQVRASLPGAKKISALSIHMKQAARQSGLSAGPALLDIFRRSVVK